MKMVSTDKYGISIQASDPKFNEGEVRSFLTGLGSRKIQPVYYDEEDLSAENKIFEPKFIAFLLFVIIFTSGAAYFGFNVMPNITPFNFMMRQQKILPQQTSKFFADGFAMRPAVEGTVARGVSPYLFKGNQVLAAAYLSNPMLPSKQNLERGRVNFNIFCSPCHGYLADGKSRLHGQFPNPPTLHSDKVRNWKDGDIYNVITSGQNIMPSYATQITPDDRWAIILYIRVLQRTQNADKEITQK
jgi:mono/diheme cytochrome c family protein